MANAQVYIFNSTGWNANMIINGYVGAAIRGWSKTSSMPYSASQSAVTRGDSDPATPGQFTNAVTNSLQVQFTSGISSSVYYSFGFPTELDVNAPVILYVFATLVYFADATGRPLVVVNGAADGTLQPDSIS